MSHNKNRPSIIVCLIGIGDGSKRSVQVWVDILSRGEETQSQGCGADSSGICSPVVGVRQLLEDAIPSSGLLLWS